MPEEIAQEEAKPKAKEDARSRLWREERERRDEAERRGEAYDDYLRRKWAALTPKERKAIREDVIATASVPVEKWPHLLESLCLGRMKK